MIDPEKTRAAEQPARSGGRIARAKNLGLEHRTEVPVNAIASDSKRRPYRVAAPGAVDKRFRRGVGRLQSGSLDKNFSTIDERRLVGARLRATRHRTP